MKKYWLVIAAGFFVVCAAAAQSAQTFTGEITDGPCAAMGGHEKMLSKGETPAQCVAECVHDGAQYVLFDAKNNITYKLDDQKKPASFAAAKVVVTGTLDKSTNTIHVASIKAS